MKLFIIMYLNLVCNKCYNIKGRKWRRIDNCTKYGDVSLKVSGDALLNISEASLERENIR